MGRKRSSRSDALAVEFHVLMVLLLNSKGFKLVRMRPEARHAYLLCGPDRSPPPGGNGLRLLMREFLALAQVSCITLMKLYNLNFRWKYRTMSRNV